MAEVHETNIRVQQVPRSRLPEVDLKNISFGTIFTDHMFQADSVEGSWTDLQLLPYGPVQFNPALMALHYGQAIFEGMKAFRTVDNEVVLFRPRANFERFNISAERMCMPVTTEEVFMVGLFRLIVVDRDALAGFDHSALCVRPCSAAADLLLGGRPSHAPGFAILRSRAGAY